MPDSKILRRTGIEPVPLAINWCGRQAC